jgi:hypothetical protein
MEWQSCSRSRGSFPLPHKRHSNMPGVHGKRQGNHLRYCRDAAVGVIKDAEQIYDAALCLLESEGFFMELP